MTLGGIAMLMGIVVFTAMRRFQEIARMTNAKGEYPTVVAADIGLPPPILLPFSAVIFGIVLGIVTLIGLVRLGWESKELNSSVARANACEIGASMQPSRYRRSLVIAALLIAVGLIPIVWCAIVLVSLFTPHKPASPEIVSAGPYELIILSFGLGALTTGSVIAVRVVVRMLQERRRRRLEGYR